MRIYTRQGDDGRTSLPGRDGPINKHDLTIVALGSLDELCSAVGVALATCDQADITQGLKTIQRLLLSLGADLADPGRTQRIGASQVRGIEGMIDRCSSELEPLDRFLLPGGSELSSRLHLARAICRRAEREVVAFAHEEPASVSPQALAFMNRLSDLLFVLAQLANKRLGIPEEEWHPEEE